MIHKILSNEQMIEADRQTIKAGTLGYTLMTTAGEAVVESILARYQSQPVLVLCGPGNNGGDGFVIARLLREQGWKVELACLVSINELKGDAAKAAQDWLGEIKSFDNLGVNKDQLIIDAVFGTGFTKVLVDPVASVFQAIQNHGNPVVAVDIPSGINGDTGEVDPNTLSAELTVTFHRKKLGHVLHPGIEYCGIILEKEIGISAEFEYSAQENHPDLWVKDFPQKGEESHKYDSGNAVIYGSPELTGATRLAASACARIGAGLVTVLATEETGPVYRESLPAHILVRDDLNWHDEKVTAKLYGSGGLATPPDFGSELPTVLDADALLNMPENLDSNFILTPHEGEFAKAFPDIEGTKLEKAQKAAQRSGAIVVLKGPDTIIAAPDGRTVINTHASKDLATAGTGDVLAGMVTGLLAQGMEPFLAACASVWIHGDCALKFGKGLVAEDLPDMIPGVLKDLS